MSKRVLGNITIFISWVMFTVAVSSILFFLLSDRIFPVNPIAGLLLLVAWPFFLHMGRLIRDDKS